MAKTKLKFKGWWGDGDHEHVPEPWEEFHVVLWADEAGDHITKPSQIRRVLAVSGYELILRKKKDG